MIYKYFNVVFFLFLGMCSFPQGTQIVKGKKKDSLSYVEYMKKAESLSRDNKKIEAKIWIKKAMEVAKRAEMHEQSVRAAVTLASYESYEGNFLRTFSILDSLESLISIKKYDDYTKAIIYDAKSIHISETGDIAKSLEYSKKTQLVLKAAERLSKYAESALKGNNAFDYYKLGLYEKSLYLALEAEKITKELYDQGELLYPNFTICINYNNLSEVYLALGNTEKALENALLGKEYYEKIGYEIFELKQRNLQVLYKALLENGDTEKALSFIEERYKTNLADSRKNIRERLKAILDLADYHLKYGESHKADTYFSLAEKTIDSITAPKGELLFAYASVIKNRLNKGELDNAYDYIDKSMGDFKLSEINSPELVLSKDYNFFAKLLSYKGKYFLERYKKSNDREFLNSSIKWYKSVYYYISFVSQNLGTQLNPKVSTDIEDITSEFLSLLLDNKNEFQNQDQWYATIANVMDFVKSFSLRSNLNKLKNIKVLGVSDVFYKEEQQLKNEINILSYIVKKGNADSESIKALNQKLTSLDSLTDIIRKEYPKYTTLNYFNPFVDEETSINENLEAGKIVLSYFYDSKYLYTLILGSEKKDFFKTEIPENFETLIDEHISSLKTINNTANLSQSTDTLYALLLSQAEHLNAKKLVIVPTKSLYKLPFETLFDINDLKNQVISYDFSIFDNGDVKSESKNKKVLIIAPVFSSDSNKSNKNIRDSYSELIYSLEEAHEIEKIFDSNSFIHEKATKKTFMSSLSHDIIHLATHVDIDNEEPLNSKIILSKNTKEDTDVSLGEIYNSQISSDMVVLSACETGIGKREKGFGVKSVANGFFFAGAKSVVMSLWQVDDRATSILMKHFYQNLNKGQRKDIALHNAKLQYLKNTQDEALKHPYYWAGFVISGDTSPVVHANYWTWIILIMSIFIVVFLLSKQLLKRI